MGHLEPAVMDDTTIEQRETHQANSVTLRKMMVETVTPDTFNPPCHELSQTIQHEPDTLLQEYESQFTQDETSIRTTPLTSMMKDTGSSGPHLSKALPHHHEALSMGERRNRKTTSSKSHP